MNYLFNENHRCLSYEESINKKNLVNYKEAVIFLRSSKVTSEKWSFFVNIFRELSEINF